MLNQTNVNYGRTRSVIRELFEYGNKRKAEIGAENVFDFSIGNPSVPTPEKVKEQLIKLVEETDPVTLHGYTSAAGDYGVRKAISDDLNSRYKTHLIPERIFMTCGAAASICITLNALLNKGDEVITFAPFFSEYSVFTANAGGVLKPTNFREDFTPDLVSFEKLLGEKTKAVIVNSPNNPSGVVYGEDVIKAIAKILTKHEERTGNRVYIISDEPYRELVYGGVKVPFIMNYYVNTITCYSFSKSLSLPGERIGYIAVNPDMKDADELFAGIGGAARALGFVCAPSLFQRLVAKSLGMTADLSIYENNRNLMYEALKSYGYDVVMPNGAFYLFVKSLESDANAFSERAKKYELLLIPSDTFGVEGYVRISYCVSPEMIKKSLPAFKKLIESYR